MKKNKFLKVFSSAVALSVVLAGCSSSSNNSSSTKGAKPKVEFKTSVDNGGNLKEGQTLKYGILSSTPLTGLWNVVFSDQATDQFVNQNVMGGTFPTDAEGRAKLDKEDAPVKMHLDREKNEVTLTIHKDLTEKTLHQKISLLHMNLWVTLNLQQTFVTMIHLNLLKV